MVNKIKYIIILILVFQNSQSQRFIVPFQVDNKYGLIDSNKKILIKPIYDNIDYIKQDYFEATLKKEYIEKIIFNDKEEDYKSEVVLKSLLKNDKVLIDNQSFDKFIITENYILGVNDFINQNLTYNQSIEIKGIRSYSVLYNLNGEKSNLGKVIEIESFYSNKNYIIIRVQKLNKSYDLIVYDLKKQKTIKKLISDSDLYFFVNHENINGNKVLKITYEGIEKFEFFKIGNDIKVYKPNKIARHPKMVSDEKIYSSDDKLTLKNDNIYKKTDDDTLFYVPNIFTFKNNKISITQDKNNLFFYNQKPFTVLRDGKFGLFNLDNSEILPIKYDFIAFNGMKLLIKNNNHYNKKTDYLIIKNNNKYGIATVEFTNNRKNFNVHYLLNPVYNGYPHFYYNNYWDVEGLKVFSIVDENGKFVQFCDNNGNCY